MLTGLLKLTKTMKTIINIGIHKHASITGIEFNKPFNEITFQEIKEIAEAEWAKTYLGPNPPPIKIGCWADVTDKWVFTEEKFFELADQTALTKPQREILKMLKAGYRITIVNKHHMSGGQWQWMDSEGNLTHQGGKIYRPFWNLVHAVLYGNGYVANIRYLNFIKD